MNANENAPWALVTGASKGLGKAIADELGSKGHNLVLVARSGEILAALAEALAMKHQIQVRYFACDASHPDAATQLHDFCISENLPISVLVNNAGIGVYDPFSESDLHALLRMNALNVDAVVRITHAFLPMLMARPRAHIMNVASTGAYQPMPTMALYGAGKSYIRSFSWALRRELRKSTVRVTCLSPGGVWTEFMDAAGNVAVSERARIFMMQADTCARAAVRGMLKGKAEVIPGWHNRFAAFMTRFAPTALNVWVAGRIFEK